MNVTAQPSGGESGSSPVFVFSGSTTGNAGDEGGGSFVINSSARSSVSAFRGTNALGHAAGDVLISELRFSGPGGDRDEYIELYNTQGSPIDLTGWALAASTQTNPLSGLSLTGKTIPAYGHLLVTNSGGYSLSTTYPATYPLNSTTPSAYAVGDVSYTGDIALNSTLSLTNAQGVVVDSVGDLSGTSGLVPTDQYAFVRRQDGAATVDTDSDSNDFNLVDTASTNGPPTGDGISTLALGARLGAPGPQNSAAPVQRSAITLTSLDSNANGGITPEGRYASRGSPLDPHGRISLRRTITNTSGQTLTQIRFILVRTTAGSSSDGSLADMRAVTSVGVSSNGTKYVQGLQIEAPTTPTIPGGTLSASTTGNGGGLNSSWNVGTLPAGGLAPGQSMNVEFAFAIVKEGNYSFALVAQVAPAAETPTPTVTPTPTPVPVAVPDASIRAVPPIDVPDVNQVRFIGDGVLGASGQTVELLSGAGGLQHIQIKLKNAGTAPGVFHLSLSSPLNGWTFFLSDSDGQVISSRAPNTWDTPSIAAGQFILLELEMRAPEHGTTAITADILVSGDGGNDQVHVNNQVQFIDHLEWRDREGNYHRVSGDTFLQIFRNETLSFLAVKGAPVGEWAPNDPTIIGPKWNLQGYGPEGDEVSLQPKSPDSNGATVSATLNNTLTARVRILPDPRVTLEADTCQALVSAASGQTQLVNVTVKVTDETRQPLGSVKVRLFATKNTGPTTLVSQWNGTGGTTEPTQTFTTDAQGQIHLQWAVPTSSVALGDVVVLRAQVINDLATGLPGVTNDAVDAFGSADTFKFTVAQGDATP